VRLALTRLMMVPVLAVVAVGCGSTGRETTSSSPAPVKPPPHSSLRSAARRYSVHEVEAAFAGQGIHLRNVTPHAYTGLLSLLDGRPAHAVYVYVTLGKFSGVLEPPIRHANVTHHGNVEVLWRRADSGTVRAALRGLDNEYAAQLAAATMLRRFVPPPGAVRLRKPPSVDGDVLRKQTLFIGGESVDRHSFWRVPAQPASVFAFVKAHPPQGAGPRPEGTGRSYGSNPTRSLDFLMGKPRGPAMAGRWIEVTIAALPHDATGVRVDAMAGWTVPRSGDEKLPSGVREIDIHVEHVSVRVTQPAKVRTIVRWFDALSIVQPGLVASCPALLFGSKVTFDFRSAGRTLLARARLSSGSVSTECNPIEFSIHGRAQTPLVGLTFWTRVKQLVGLGSGAQR